ncbi:MAG TPA: DUF5681 domain-containing protein [Bradyrhizobium sp.]|uniref:DUF5681 domain-containing protein n=1 Tax=Bradyrhizobium sp. TaxID=376 RepID=UPI002CD864FD|nr:DUF5681 domain-containing protein [Bradyrhizobium sp.]HLZ00635.1 DUF5681 domain-containing protein [Bradyrhizobium sp.]
MTKDKRSPSSNYRNPPAAYRFKKGQSGNPKGRPRKKKAIGANFGALRGGIADRFAFMALEEATRLVTVPEGNKASKIPAMQALIRTMFTAAAQGDTKAGRQLLDVIARAESARAADAQELVGYAMLYKERYQEVDPPDDLYPHPDDVIIDRATGAVEVDGPITKDEADGRQAVRERAIRSLGRYLEVEAALKEDPTNVDLRREFKELKKYYDFLKNDSARNARLEALRLSRRALQKPESNDDVSDQ